VAPERLVAIGDLHGDWTIASRVLRGIGAVDSRAKWIGGQLGIVVTGDLLDRGTEERALVDNLHRLTAEARAAGGRLYLLDGNHEIMNVANDYRYVTAEGLAEFAAFAPSAGSAKTNLEGMLAGRQAAFLPGGPYARILAENPVVLLVGDTLFAHGGVLPKHVEYGLGRMNDEVSAWMKGERPLPTALQGDDAPFWVREYGEQVTGPDCEALASVLTQVGAKRLVVGHTPQKGGITFACGGRVARIDVGLSVAYGRQALAVLSIDSGEARVVTLPTTEDP
jgi:hypothetical protein